MCKHIKHKQYIYSKVHTELHLHNDDKLSWLTTVIDFKYKVLHQTKLHKQQNSQYVNKSYMCTSNEAPKL